MSAALNSDPPGEWQSSWRRLWIALKGDPARLRDTLQRFLPPPPDSPAVRFSILTELQELQPLPILQQLPLHLLLRQCSADELERFARSNLPREWYVWAAVLSSLMRKFSERFITPARK